MPLRALTRGNEAANYYTASLQPDREIGHLKSGDGFSHFKAGDLAHCAYSHGLCGLRQKGAGETRFDKLGGSPATLCP